MVRSLSSSRSMTPQSADAGLKPDRKAGRILGKEAGLTLGREAGLTLIELIVTVAILALLASAAVPIARWDIKRVKERELRDDLWQMRAAIDKYKDAADKGGIQTKVDSDNYPPDLDTLVKGIEVQGKKVRFLRRIPVDPMTGKPEWGMRSEQDDPTGDSFGGQNLFDVYSKSQGTALNGTKYASW